MHNPAQRQSLSWFCPDPESWCEHAVYLCCAGPNKTWNQPTLKWFFVLSLTLIHSLQIHYSLLNTNWNECWLDRVSLMKILVFLETSSPSLCRSHFMWGERLWAGTHLAFSLVFTFLWNPAMKTHTVNSSFINLYSECLHHYSVCVCVCYCSPAWILLHVRLHMFTHMYVVFVQLHYQGRCILILHVCAAVCPGMCASAHVNVWMCSLLFGQQV